VRLKAQSRIATILLIIAMTAGTAEAWPHHHGHRVHVRFLATSTVIRSTWFWNEDTYLAELNFPRSNESVLVRLIDAYPSEAPPLARQVLQSDAGTVMAVKRDVECDRPFGEILLRTTPGDPMAILPERMVYQPQMGHVPGQQTILPCYRVMRH